MDNAGKKLKSVDGWSVNNNDDDDYEDEEEAEISSSNGTDDYGFAALPGGSYVNATNQLPSSGCENKQGSWTPGQDLCPGSTTTITTNLFSNAGSAGFWWSSSWEKDPRDAGKNYGRQIYYLRYIYSGDYVGRGSRNTGTNNDYLSVRCLKD